MNCAALMNCKFFTLLQAFGFALLINSGCKADTNYPNFPISKLTHQYFQADSQWYLDNIPFFECSDKKIEEIYYYRWKNYKAHIRNVGQDQYVITEFINDVHWDIDPYSTINAATMHHIYEGRWLKDDRFMNGYINYMYFKRGNNRAYSESIADAAYARYLVNGDKQFIISQLDSMKFMYDQWSDHWDSTKQLYFIPAMPDATEYTIASIDASGGKDGFAGGEAFRPTINSYMYGNAIAISKIAALKGDSATSREYLYRATRLRKNILKDLWNDSLQHFTDRYALSNQFVHYWDFIRGRELAGYSPWYFNVPDESKNYSLAWKHVMDTSELLGKYGLRTNEPSYEHYFTQYTFSFGKPGSQWNGPSWPYVTSQVITSMANLLNNYQQEVISNSDYLKLLRQFTQQHYLSNGKIDLVENYEPNKGGPIVHFYWSNHYNHSSYDNLVISGLCGLRPSDGDTLTINPLIDSSIKYLALNNLSYHGHILSVFYDADGTRYKIGKGLHVLVDGKMRGIISNGLKSQVYIGPPLPRASIKEPLNVALNIKRTGYPMASASVDTLRDSLYQAIDGRIWYFPEITNYWPSTGSTSGNDWFALDFGRKREISSVKIYMYADEVTYDLPESFNIEFKNGEEWKPVNSSLHNPTKLAANTGTTLLFEKVKTSGVRVNLRHSKKQVAIGELECY